MISANNFADCACFDIACNYIKTIAALPMRRRNESERHLIMLFAVSPWTDKSLDSLQFTNFAPGHYNDACDSRVHWSDGITAAADFFHVMSAPERASVRDRNFQRTKRTPWRIFAQMQKVVAAWIAFWC